MDRARRRITRRLMPYLLLLYLVAFLDRTNVAVAGLGMKKDLGFTEAIIGSGAGIFFLGYFLLEVPGTLIVERWSARKWISRIMITWGIVASAMGLIGLPFLGGMDHKSQFYGFRFLLGLGEAGFFPGVVLYLSHWFRYEDRARAKSLFMVSIPAATVISTPLSKFILNNVHWQNLAGWRWVFILEGIPAVILGLVTIFYLTDRPEQAKWLPDEEKAWIVGELARERATKIAIGGGDILRGLLNPRVLLLMVIYFFGVIGVYGIGFFLPAITKTMTDMPDGAQTAIATVPYVCGCVVMLLNARHSDKTGERRWHTVGPLLLASVSMALCVLSYGVRPLEIFFLCTLGAGLSTHLPVFWTHPTMRLTGSAAAVAIGLINSFGNLGGFVGPLIVGRLTTDTGSFRAGMWFLSGCLLLAAFLATFLKPEPPPSPAIL